MATDAVIKGAWATYIHELYDGYMKSNSSGVRVNFQEQRCPKMVNAKIHVDPAERIKYKTQEHFVLGSIPVRYDSAPSLFDCVTCSI